MENVTCFAVLAAISLLTSNSFAGVNVYYGTNSNKTLYKEFDVGSTVKCGRQTADQSFYGSADPVPGVLKSCYILENGTFRTMVAQNNSFIVPAPSPSSSPSSSPRQTVTVLCPQLVVPSGWTYSTGTLVGQMDVSSYQKLTCHYQGYQITQSYPAGTTSCNINMQSTTALCQ